MAKTAAVKKTKRGNTDPCAMCGQPINWAQLGHAVYYTKTDGGWGLAHKECAQPFFLQRRFFTAWRQARTRTAHRWSSNSRSYPVPFKQRGFNMRWLP